MAKSTQKRSAQCVLETDLLGQLGSKEISKAQLLKRVEEDFSLVPTLFEGTSSAKAAIRYGCGSVLMDLCEKHPAKLYPYMDSFVGLLESKHRILMWNALGAIANLTAADSEGKFDAILGRYYSYLGNEYMVTVANVVAFSARIIANKLYLADKITAELLKVQNIQTTPHLTDECKLVIAERAIETFNSFFERSQNREQILAFAKKYVNSPRKSLSKKAQSLVMKAVFA